MTDGGTGPSSRPGMWSTRLRAFSACVSAACLAVGACLLVAGFVGPRLDTSWGAPSQARSGVAVKGSGIFGLGSRFSPGRGYERYGYVVVDRANARSVAGLPGTSLVYMSGADIAWFNTGVPAKVAAARGWLLKDANGKNIQADDYDDVQLADVGNKDYQRAWLRNVEAFLRSSKVDGVFIDDVMADTRPWTGQDELPPKYPSPEAWQAAQVSFMKAVGPALKTQGYYVLVNAVGYVRGDSRSDDGSFAIDWWRRLAPSVSGLLAEHWMQSSTDLSQLRGAGTDWDQQWAGWQRLVSTAERARVDFFGLTYGPTNDQRPLRYGRGSFLLDWSRSGGAFVFGETEDHAAPTKRTWARDLGRPLGRKAEISPGVWRRPFARGVVVVNSTSDPVSVVVNGSRRTIGPSDALVGG